MTETPSPLRAPEPLSEAHHVGSFSCGEPTLDLWLKRRALANQTNGASRTFVVCREAAVQGYYALAAGSVDHRAAPGRLRRNMADPIPVVVLARLAVTASEQGSRLGRPLVRDAVRRIRAAASEIGIAAILVHALNERAKRFYLTCGFVESVIDESILVARLKDSHLREHGIEPRRPASDSPSRREPSTESARPNRGCGSRSRLTRLGWTRGAPAQCSLSAACGTPVSPSVDASPPARIP